MKTLFTFLCCIAIVQLFAQHQQHPHWGLPCGTNAEKDEFLQLYQRNPALYAAASRNTTTRYLPLTLHLVGRSDSTAAVALQSVLSSFCRLNADYQPADIQFFIEFPILYHYSDSMYAHNSVVYGGQFMLQHNVSNTINVYFVSSPAGNCGYNLPYSGIAMNNGCLGGHTFAHEMGHALSLPHTFLGWEGGQSWDNSVSPNYNRPAPRRVTYNYTDFKDTIWTDTLIIDTAYTELVARTGVGSNCAIAADGFCDTEADYLASRWLCDNNNRSVVQQLDADSIPFLSNGEYIMSYADDNCQSIFTMEQQAAMNAFITTLRQAYLYNQSPNNAIITSSSTLIYPNNSLIIPQTNIQFTWAAVPNATHYILEIYREPYASNTIIKTLLVADTNYIYNGSLAPRPAIFPYAWRVQPFNQGYSCSQFSPVTNFNTIIPASVEQQVSNTEFNLYPNPSQGSTSLNIELIANKNTTGFLRIYNAVGQCVAAQNVELTAANNQFIIDTDKLRSGLYLIEFSNAEELQVRKYIKN